MNQNINTQMKIYSSKHALNALSKYDPCKLNLCDTDIGTYICDNFDTMDDSELKKITLKCLNINDCKKILLNYELHTRILTSIDNNNVLTLKEFEKKSINIFNRYQNRAGGFALEDRQWRVHTVLSNRYQVIENEILFENSVPLVDEEDRETNIYLKNIVKLLNTLSKNIVVELREKQRKNSKIINVLIWGTDINQQFLGSESLD